MFRRMSAVFGAVLGMMMLANAADAAKVKELGGTVYWGPDSIPGIGRFAVAADPTGPPGH